jgi:AmmeMemoRadiSam system protein B
MRYPSAAGRFYPLDKSELIESIESCFSHSLGPGMPSESNGKRDIVAVLTPHAGYAASGMNAAHAFKALAEDGKPDAYIVIGPDHYGIPFDFVTCNEDFLTPLGPCKIHVEIVSRLSKYIACNIQAHRAEHSVEVEIPFIQYIDPDARIVPIIMGRQDIASAHKLAEILKTVCKDFDVVIVASSDMAHYMPKELSKSLNLSVLEKYSEKDVDGMYSEIFGKRISVCGYGPMAVSILATNPSKIKILKYSDSWDSLNYDMNSVVGYATATLFKRYTQSDL